MKTYFTDDSDDADAAYMQTTKLSGRRQTMSGGKGQSSAPAQTSGHKQSGPKSDPTNKDKLQSQDGSKSIHEGKKGNLGTGGGLQRVRFAIKRKPFSSKLKLNHASPYPMHPPVLPHVVEIGKILDQLRSNHADNTTVVKQILTEVLKRPTVTGTDLLQFIPILESYEATWDPILSDYNKVLGKGFQKVPPADQLRSLLDRHVQHAKGFDGAWAELLSDRSFEVITILKKALKVGRMREKNSGHIERIKHLLKLEEEFTTGPGGTSTGRELQAALHELAPTAVPATTLPPGAILGFVRKDDGGFLRVGKASLTEVTGGELGSEEVVKSALDPPPPTLDLTKVSEDNPKLEEEEEEMQAEEMQPPIPDKLPTSQGPQGYPAVGGWSNFPPQSQGPQGPYVGYYQPYPAPQGAYPYGYAPHPHPYPPYQHPWPGYQAAQAPPGPGVPWVHPTIPTGPAAPPLMDPAVSEISSEHTDANPVVATKSKLKIPQPAKFTGENKEEDVEDYLFSFENYLEGTGVARDRWATVGMHLLDKLALRTYITYAKPLQAAGTPITWETFRHSLTSAFAHPDRQLSARQQLLQVSQTTSVIAYVQHVRMLLARAGLPAPTDRDLTLVYWRGLKQHIRDQSQVDPTTGRFWESFDNLVKHTVTIDTQRVPGALHEDKRGGKFKSFLNKPKPPVLKAVQAKKTPTSSLQVTKQGTKKRNAPDQQDRKACSDCGCPPGTGAKGPYLKWDHTPGCAGKQRVMESNQAKKPATKNSN